MTIANQAIEEIKAIVRKYDLAANVIVQSPDECAFLREISPSWSCAFFEDTPQGMTIRVKAKRSDFPSKEAQRKKVGETTGMVVSFFNRAKEDVVNYGNLAAMLSRHFEILHTERDYSPGSSI